MAMPELARRRISSYTSDFAPTSIPCVGSSRMSTCGATASHRASTVFCWLPPERLRTGSSGERSLMERFWMDVRTVALMRPRSREIPLFMPGSAASAHVEPDRHVHEEGQLLPVLGDHGKPGHDGLARVGKRNGAAVEEHLSALRAVRAEDRRATPRCAPTPRGRQSRGPLRRAGRTTHRRNPSPDSPRTLRTTGPAAPRGNVFPGELAAHHHVDDRLRRGLRPRNGADQPAVAQDGDAVRDPQDLVDLVGDVDHRNAPCLQGADDGEKPLRLRLAQG